MALTVQSPLCSTESWPTSCQSLFSQPSIYTNFSIKFCPVTTDAITWLCVHEKPKLGRARASLQISQVAKQEGAKGPVQAHRAEPRPCVESERRAIQFSACALGCFSPVRLVVTLWTVAHQVPLSMGILQTRTLEWVAMPSSRGSSQSRDQTQVSCIAGRFFTI